MKSDYIHIVKNVFSKDMMNLLYESCQNQFLNNLSQSDDIDLTRNIIDCHGLSLSGGSYFPYNEKCWNVFCLKVKHYVVEYCNIVGIDESIIVPHSCWSERSNRKPSSNKVYQDGMNNNTDDWLKKHLIRVVYFLKNKYPFFGTDIQIEDTINCVQGEENSLVIFDSGTNRTSNKFPTNALTPKYNICFDWYINEPFHVPDWVLP
jgi:hypothetical protein